MLEVIKKYKRRSYILIAIFVFGIPFLIHCLFKLPARYNFFVAEWSAGEFLSYYGTMILGLITIYLAYVAVKQTQAANDTNNRLLKIGEMERKVFLKINECKSKIEDRDNIKFVSICFENTTDILIVDFHVEGSNKLLLETNWVFNRESEKTGIIVTDYQSITGEGLINEDKTFTYTFAFNKYDNPFLLISFKSVSKSIYGLVSTQNYNIILTDNVLNGYKTSIEEEV